MKVYAVRLIGSDRLTRKYDSNAIYVTKGSARARANSMNRQYAQPMYEVVSGEFEWKVEE